MSSFRNSVEKESGGCKPGEEPAPDSTERESATMAILLHQFDADPVVAEQMYARLHVRLTRFFEYQNRWNAGDLTDETFRRVAQKVAVGEKFENIARYSLKVARFILKETWREKGQTLPLEEEGVPTQPQKEDPNDEATLRRIRRAFMRKCIEALKPESYRVVREYFRLREGEKHKEMRRLLAEECGLSMEALRKRVFDLRTRLRSCYEKLCRERGVTPLTRFG